MSKMIGAIIQRFNFLQIIIGKSQSHLGLSRFINRSYTVQSTAKNPFRW